MSVKSTKITEFERAVADQVRSNAETDRAELEGDLKWLLDDVRGRRILRYLRRCARVDESQVIESETVFAYGAGRRETGLKFAEACRAVSALNVAKAEAEEAQRIDVRAAARRRLAQIHKQKRGE